MRHIALILFLGSLTLASRAQSGSGQVSQHIQETRSAGTSFQPSALFSMPTRSASTDALWDQEIARATVLHLNTADVATMLRESPDHIAFELPSANGAIILDLERVSILMDDFTVVQASTGGAVDVPQGLHYRGMQRNEPGSVASISIFENEVMGLISGNDGDLVLGKIDGAGNGEHVLYRTADLRDNSGPTCSAVDDGPGYTEDELQPGSPKTVKCVRFYWELNYDIYQGKGSVAAATSYVTGLFNQSATLYANDGISVMLQQVFVWDVPSPYTAITTLDLLNQFGAYRTSFNGDLAHLLGYVGDGGVAYVNQLCNTQLNLKMAYSDIDATYSNVPTFSWSIEVVTHEQGHLLGSRHTHACAWNGNNTRIDGCGPAAGYNEGSCAAASVPSSSVGGTIMSYCHLLSAGIKFSNGFGPQPTALIVNNINNASCLTACGPPPACGTPTGMSAGSITSTSALVSWSVVSGATSYTLQWKPTSSGTFNTVTGLTNTNYPLSGLASNTAHHFQVLAVCASGSSSYSTLTAFTTAAGTCADAYEPNNSTGAAAVIPANSTTSASIGVNGDLDWFRFSNTAAQPNIKVTLTNLAANYQLRLYRGSTQLATSSNSGITSEQIIYNTSTVSTNYKVKINAVTGAFNASQCYVLTIQISSSAFTTQAMEGGEVEVVENEEAVSIHPNPTSDAVNVVLPPSDLPSTVDVLDATGRMVGSFDSDAVDVRTNLVFDMSDKPEGIYLVRVTRGSETTVQRLVVAR